MWLQAFGLCLVHIPTDLAGGLFGRALLSQRTALAIELARSIGQGPILGHPAGRLEDLVAWAEIDAPPLAEAEVGAREGAAVSLAFFPDRMCGAIRWLTNQPKNLPVP